MNKQNIYFNQYIVHGCTFGNKRHENIQVDIGAFKQDRYAIARDHPG